jgi:5'-3' exonuclease
MHALIDGDILIYRVGFTTENEDWGIAKFRMNEMIDNILQAVHAQSYSIYLSDSTTNNFRTKFYPEYKANRKQPKPKHYEGLKYYLVTEEDARITPEQEADDELGIQQTLWNRELETIQSIICTIDKDLLQIPGNHYNFVKNEHRFVTPDEGLRHFYTQLLVGDTSDNIRGVQGIGPKKAEKALLDCRTPQEYFEVTAGLYEKDFKRILINGILLKIRTEKDELWSFPPGFENVQPAMEDLLSSGQTKPKEIIQSSEPSIPA